MIKGGITRDHNPRSRSTSIKNGGGTGSDTASMNSMDSNWLMRGTTELRQQHHHDVIMRQKKVTDSVRSATVRRSATNSNPYLRGTSGTETPPEDLRRGIPVMIPTPHLNAQQQLKKVEKKPADLKIPLGMNQIYCVVDFFVKSISRKISRKHFTKKQNKYFTNLISNGQTFIFQSLIKLQELLVLIVPVFNSVYLRILCKKIQLC